MDVELTKLENDQPNTSSYKDSREEPTKQNMVMLLHNADGGTHGGQEVVIQADSSQPNTSSCSREEPTGQNMVMLLHNADMGTHRGPEVVIQASRSQIPRDFPKPSVSVALSCCVAWCCCAPLGLLAFVYSMRSSASFDRRDYVQARVYGNTSRNLSFAGLFLGIIFFFLNAIIYAVMLADNEN